MAREYVPHSVRVVPENSVVVPDAVVEVEPRADQVAVRVVAACAHEVAIDDNGALLAAQAELVGEGEWQRREKDREPHCC